MLLKIALVAGAALIVIYVVAIVLFSLGSGFDKSIDRPVSPAQARGH